MNVVVTQKFAMEMFKDCIKFNISLHTQWVPREFNWLRKYKDTEDWSIDDKSFKSISRRFGPFTIDIFADINNKKTPIWHCYSEMEGIEGPKHTIYTPRRSAYQANEVNSQMERHRGREICIELYTLLRKGSFFVVFFFIILDKIWSRIKD